MGGSGASLLGCEPFSFSPRPRNNRCSQGEVIKKHGESISTPPSLSPVRRQAVTVRLSPGVLAGSLRKAALQRRALSPRPLTARRESVGAGGRVALKRAFLTYAGTGAAAGSRPGFAGSSFAHRPRRWRRRRSESHSHSPTHGFLSRNWNQCSSFSLETGALVLLGRGAGKLTTNQAGRVGLT